jgi:hypothetical protein
VPDDQPRKLFFHGSAQSIECAVNLVNKLLLSAPNLAGKHGAIKKLYSNIVECPVDLVGLLIGKKGWTIKKIQLESGAQISINQSVREGQPRKIIVSGMQPSVELATHLIEEVLRNKPDEDELMALGSLSLSSRSDPLLLPHLATSSGGMYAADGTLSADYAPSQSPPRQGFSGSDRELRHLRDREEMRQARDRDELSRHTTLVRGNEALFLQSYPSVMSQMHPITSPRANRRASLSSYGQSQFSPRDFSLPRESSTLSSLDPIFDTRRRSGSEPDFNENFAGTTLGDSMFSGPVAQSAFPRVESGLHGVSRLAEDEMDSARAVRRVSTGSISPAHIARLDMGFGAAEHPSSMYARAEVREDTIAQQLQLKALHKQRILQLQKEQKEQQMTSLKMQQQQQLQQQLHIQMQSSHYNHTSPSNPYQLPPRPSSALESGSESGLEKYWSIQASGGGQPSRGPSAMLPPPPGLPLSKRVGSFSNESLFN